MDYGADVYCLEYILKVLGFCSLLLMKDRYRYLFLNIYYICFGLVDYDDVMYRM